MIELPAFMCIAASRASRNGARTLMFHCLSRASSLVSLSWCGVKDSSGIDEDVDATKTGDYPIDDLRGCLIASHVNAQKPYPASAAGQLIGDLCQSGLVAGHQKNVRSGRMQSARRASADPGVRSGDDSCLTYQVN